MARSTRTKALVAEAGPQEFTLPHRYRPRSYEREVFAAYERGCKRFVLRWHRRAGKDLTSLALTQVAMADRPGLYLHVYPTQALGRAALWEARDREGVPFLDRFPAAWLEGEPNKTEMMVRVKALPGQPAGSMWKVAGADDPDSLRGLNPVGVVLSEFSEHDPRLWDEVLSPIFAENDGWILFNFTPKGKNHAYKVEQSARANPSRWFLSVKTVEDTVRDAPGERGGPVVPPAFIEQERREGKSEESIQQEYFVSYAGYQVGTIYGDLLYRARREGRIRPLVRDANEPVGVCMDIGRSDGTAAIFYQTRGKAVSIIDYFACRGKASDYAFQAIQRKPYFLGKIILPRDAASKPQAETYGLSTAELAEQLWPGLVHVNDAGEMKPTVESGIDAVLRCGSRFEFHEPACEAEQEDGMPSLLDSLGNYRRAKNLTTGEYTGAPVHDAHSHGADALREGVKYGFPPLEFTDRQERPTHAECRVLALAGGGGSYGQSRIRRER